MNDLTEQTFGRLRVIQRSGTYVYVGKDKVHKQAKWLCQCDCGGTATPTTHALRSGNTTSCGCMQRERAAECRRGMATHGHTRGKKVSPEFAAWQAMIARCTNSNIPGYKRWGGRGIKVCERWLNSFGAFFADMGPRPPTSPNNKRSKYSIERKKNDEDYTPENCCWATAVAQNNNRCSTRLVTAFGITQSVSEWSRAVGINKGTLKDRLDRGWTPEKAVTPIPPR